MQVSQWLGHSTYTLTLDVYGDCIPERDDGATNNLPEGGLSKQAQEALKTHQLRVRGWEAAEVVDAVLAHYERLDDDIRSRLPLKRVWMLAEPGA
jgi:hypothetical protein